MTNNGTNNKYFYDLKILVKLITDKLIRKVKVFIKAKPFLFC